MGLVKIAKFLTTLVKICDPIFMSLSLGFALSMYEINYSAVPGFSVDDNISGVLNFYFQRILVLHLLHYKVTYQRERALRHKNT